MAACSRTAAAAELADVACVLHVGQVRQTVASAPQASFRKRSRLLQRWLRPMKRLRRRIVRLFPAVVVGVLASAPAAAQSGYREPPPEVVGIVDAPAAPFVSTSPDRWWLVLAHRKNMPSIEEQSQPMLRLAGRRINPVANGPFGVSLITGIGLLEVESGTKWTVDAARRRRRLVDAGVLGRRRGGWRWNGPRRKARSCGSWTSRRARRFVVVGPRLNGTMGRSVPVDAFGGRRCSAGWCRRKGALAPERPATPGRAGDPRVGRQECAGADVPGLC